MPEHQYTSWEQVWVDLGGKPNSDEVARLRIYYPTYEFPRRLPLLEGLLWGGSDTETMLAKLDAKGLDASSLTKRSLAGHRQWARAKMRKAVFRVLYLRYRLDEHLQRTPANQKLFQKFFKSGNKESLQSSIRKFTRSPVLDK